MTTDVSQEYDDYGHLKLIRPATIHTPRLPAECHNLSPQALSSNWTPHNIARTTTNQPSNPQTTNDSMSLQPLELFTILFYNKQLYNYLMKDFSY